MPTARRSTGARRRALLLSAGVAAATALTLGGCSGADTEADGTVTLKLSLFGQIGNIPELIDEYEAEHPGVTVDIGVTASADDARTNLFTKLAAGTGLGDVEQLEAAWVGDLARHSDRFVPVPVADDDHGDFVKVQTDPVIDDDGTRWAYGYGTGPEAICYREDMLADAGLPTDPESVSAMFEGSWQDYFSAGEQYVAGGGAGAWYDSAYLTYNAQVAQLEYPYEDAEDRVVVDNPEVERIFKETLRNSEHLSAGLSPFSNDWNTGLGTDKFATMTCPSWMLATVSGFAPEVSGWRIANAFPGGGGNVGGSYLTVPTQSEHPEEAAELARWITSPEVQIEIFKTGGSFPSREQALDDPALTDVTDPYFDDAPTGSIFADRSEAITTVMYQGPSYLAIDKAAFNAMTRVETGRQSIDDAWQQFVTESEDAEK